MVQQGEALAACGESARLALRTAAQAAVGVLGVVEAQRVLRKAMLDRAFEQTCGNRHATARLLCVDRRYVTKMLKR